MCSTERHPACFEPDVLLKGCRVRRARRSGPGGQHRNKVETAVIIRHLSTGIEAEANERRSAADNERMAVKRLRLKLALEVRSPVAASGQPSRLWQSRCKNRRISVNLDHVDFPGLLAEALDSVFACGMDVAQAAAYLDCTASQLVKFLKSEPRGLAIVNSHRQALGLHDLK